MAVNDFTGKNIQDTYQKVVQTDGTNLADGTGSLLPISFDGNNVTISGSLTAHTYILSSSVIVTNAGSTTFGDSSNDTHTFKGDVSIISTNQDAISTNGSIIGGHMVSARTGSFNQISLTNLAPNSPEPSDPTLNVIGLKNLLRAFSTTEDSNTIRGFGSNVGFIENLASTVGTFGTGTTLINDNISSSGDLTVRQITASGNIITTKNIIGTINGGSF